jgi:Rrf2 family transcriptional regulator, iron-sulfur cluster assembly transcription factor
MMGLTNKGEYAVRGIIYLAQQPPGRMVLVSEIASAAEAPQSFLAKIMQQFTRMNLVQSSRGTGGGFTLARPASEITLREVVEAVEGPIIVNRCILGTGICSRDGCCQVHQVWRNIQRHIVESLDGVTIEELAQKAS